METKPTKAQDTGTGHKSSTAAFYALVKADFNKLLNHKADGVQKYSNGYIYKALSKKHFRSTGTIKKIVFGHTAQPNRIKKAA